MAKKTGSAKTSGGAMVQLRSAFSTLGGKRARGGMRGRKGEPDFLTVLGWVALVGVVGLLIWGIR